MRKILILTSILLFSLLGFAQTTAVSDTVFNQTDHLNQKQGYWKKFYRNGKMAYQGFFKDDKPRGAFVRFHETGVVSARLNFSHCGDTATAILYNTLTRRVAEGKYLRTKKHGIWNYFAPDGRLVFTEEFNEGVKNGRFLTYYANGQVFEQVTWKNDEKNGSTVQYYPNGTTKSMVFYKYGLEDGHIRTYYVGGEVRLEGMYSRGVKSDTWRILSPEGKVLNLITYVNGVATNHDELVEKETKELELLLKNAGKIQEPAIEDFVRGMGF
jgi:antitoxin component YwqK of YwqJK toxin-antitoxin module